MVSNFRERLVAFWGKVPSGQKKKEKRRSGEGGRPGREKHFPSKKDPPPEEKGQREKKPGGAAHMGNLPLRPERFSHPEKKGKKTREKAGGDQKKLSGVKWKKGQKKKTKAGRKSPLSWGGHRTGSVQKKGGKQRGGKACQGGVCGPVN